jgi:carbonic anhydrase
MDMKHVEIVYRYGPGDAVIRPRPADAGEARRRLDEGNRAFAALLDNVGEEGPAARRVVEVDPRDLGLLSAGGTPTQRPYAAVLGCADARVPVELVFSEGPNDLFVVRVAGNGLGGDALGSLKYAVDHLGDSLKLVSSSPSGCGAITAAVDIFLDPAGTCQSPKYTMRGLLDRLLVVVHRRRGG